MTRLTSTALIVVIALATTNYQYNLFDDSPLYQGFTFSDSFGEYETKMVVYGDGTYGSGPW